MVTSRRVIFTPNNFDRLFWGRCISIPLDEIRGAEVERRTASRALQFGLAAAGRPVVHIRTDDDSYHFTVQDAETLVSALVGV